MDERVYAAEPVHEQQLAAAVGCFLFARLAFLFTACSCLTLPSFTFLGFLLSGFVYGLARAGFAFGGLP